MRLKVSAYRLQKDNKGDRDFVKKINKNGIQRH